MASNDSSNTLYFIVGGLVVLAIIFGFAMWGPYDMSASGPATIQPAAGNSSASNTTHTDQTKIESSTSDGSKAVTQTTTNQTNNP